MPKLIDLLEDADASIRDAACVTIGRIVTARFMFRELLPQDAGYDPASEDEAARRRAVRTFRKAWARLMKVRGKSFVPEVKTDPGSSPERPAGTRWGAALGR